LKCGEFLKVAMLTSVPFPPVCGIGSYINNLSRKLTHEGHEVIVVTRGGPKKQVIEYDKILVYKLPFIMAYPFHVDVHGIFVNSFLKELKENLDIIHVHWPLTPTPTVPIPVVTTFHSPYFADSYATKIIDTHSFLTKILGISSYPDEKKLIFSSQVISTVSESVASALVNCYGVERRAVMVLGNAVSDLFLEGGRDTPKQRDDHLILYTGRLDYHKGVIDLVRSMKLVTRNVPNAKLVIMGKGPLLSSIRKEIADLDLQKSVEVRGFLTQEEVLNVSLHASIFVLPSYHEGLPTSVLEAMACQLAVIATSVRGNIDIVKNGETGILVPPREPKALACAITYLLQNRDQREKLAKRGRKLVEEKFTLDKLADGVLSAYGLAKKRKNAATFQ
jgi:glycosyltransferase involved in cell wall biosynthesis